MKKLFPILCILFLLGLGAQSTFANVPIPGGTYTIGNEYATLALAIADLNTRGVGGAVTFNVPASYTETFGSKTAGQISITSNAPTSTNTVTFQKSGTGADPLITAAVLSASGSGTYIIKILGTSYITFNGIDVQENSSNTVAADKTEYGYAINNNAAVAGSSYITIENCSVTLDATSSNYTYAVDDYNNNAAVNNSHNTYSNVTVQNADYGIYVSGSASNVGVGNTVTGCTVNNLGGAHNGYVDGIAGSNQSGFTVTGCEVEHLTITTSTSAKNVEGIYLTNLSGTNNVIANNKVHDITNSDGFSSTPASIYAAGIYMGLLSSSDAVTAYNNMVYAIGSGGGLGTGNAPDTNIVGMYCFGAGTFNIYFNSIYLANTTSNYNFYTTCLYFTNPPATINVENNILKNTYTGTGIKSYCVVYNVGTINNSDYNNYDCAATTTLLTAGTGPGFLPASTDCPALADLQGATGFDADSYQFTTDFTNITAGSENLHLNVNHANGHYIGTPIPGITTDIDGDTRDATYPYIGADEVTAYPLPVELTAFNATVSGKSVNLAWRTATEINNSGFEVERNAAGTWTQVGFVAGNGTSNSPHSYSYVDAVAAGNYSYRLKQIDHNGAFVYSQTIQAAVGLSPSDYALSQNYPNPFNPTTMITFAVKTDQKASMKVYNMLGQEVMTLFDGDAKANQLYQVQFNASSLASGTYFYSLQTADSRQIKKMLLLK